MLTDMETFCGPIGNNSVCKICQGECCKRFACDNSPLDFDNNTDKMEKALESGKYSIDFARKSPYSFVKRDGHLSLDLNHIINTVDEALYIRPRNVNRPLFDIIHSEGNEGPCIFWSLEKGCDLKYKDRPMFGRLIYPIVPHFCINLYDKQILLDVWKPFTPFLYEMAKKNFPEDWAPYKEINFRL